MRAYKTTSKSTSSKADIKIKVYPGSLLAKKLKVGRKELKRYVVSSQITLLEAKASKLIDLIRDVLCELDSKYTLNLFNQHVDPYIHITGNNLLNLSLAASSTFFCDSISNTYMNRGDYINNNLILILRVQVSINLPRAVLILAFILGAFGVFI